MTSNQHGPYVRGDTRVTMVGTEGSYPAMDVNLGKAQFDWRLKPASMKLDSLVIAHQPWRGEYVPGPCTHRACQAMGELGVPLEVRDRKERPRAKLVTGG